MSDNKIKFLHFNNSEANRKLSAKQAKKNQSRTVAVLAISPNFIRDTVFIFTNLNPQEHTAIPLMVGVELVSLNDNYSRAIGRDNSVKKMKEVELAVVGVTINATHTFLHFEEHEGVKLSARLNRLTGFSTIVGTQVK